MHRTHSYPTDYGDGLHNWPIQYLQCLLMHVVSAITSDKIKRNGFVNNYGYGPHGIGPSNVGVDSFGFFK
ncbi:hypothetical protein KIN20_010127 [Parelaphostrongylus tenuis]|uniref:Uncharacterized protein n=1 Tax=Parelaphostrongylus tenuis TaxID=148309 RepID=A0AAD5MYM0_PARTN|nr:hypothetical protein KIN20_010127 [Parelaphostrongylus tenuis]